MKRMNLEASRRAVLGAGMAGIAAAGVARAGETSSGQGNMLAPRPPMGWNSWNSFATTITEAQTREIAAIMADKLLPFGYDILTVDIQWYEPEASSYTYNAKPNPAMDAYGRMIPALNRFPSSAQGRGFAPLAQAVHALGLKFGIHVMRGIPRAAVDRNLPVLGTDVRAADIADRSNICSWNPDMYGVDMAKPGAQAYYDSIFRLYADWGVDFVKMDDMSRPYDAHAPEIEAAHKAIAATGRPIILSLSPGETPVIRGDHVRRYARCGASRTISGMTGQCWRRSSPGWRIGRPIVAPAVGRTPTCSPSAGWRSANATRASPPTNSAR
jgi:alpha-galactosidase